MKQHYRKFKGYKRYPGRTVYMVPVSKEEVRERRLLAAVISVSVALLGSGVMWMVSIV